MKRERGRPRFDGAVYQLMLSPSQREKVRQNGGAAWVRKLIEQSQSGKGLYN